MDGFQYLDCDDVVALLDDILGRMGAGPSTLIHRDKLESAVHRPRNLAYYENADLIRQATSLAVGISQSQAFLDGNKRASFAASVVFLRINGKLLSGDPLEFAMRLERVAEAVQGDARVHMVDQLDEWLRSNTSPVMLD